MRRTTDRQVGSVRKKRETPGEQTGQPEEVTYERWLAIAVGQMGMSPETFQRITPAEFIYAWLGWSELERSRVQQAWERERWAVWVLTSIQMDRKDRQPMTQMFPLPWESQPTQATELTMEERLERVNRILNVKPDET